MARTRMVTRTINVTSITALCMDLKKVEPITKVLELTGETYDEAKALKVAKKLYDSEELSVVKITALDTHEEIYGMLETDFLQHAHKLDADRKMIEDVETSEEASEE